MKQWLVLVVLAFLVYDIGVAQDVTMDSGEATEKTEGEGNFLDDAVEFLTGFLEKEEEDTSILKEGPPPLLNPIYKDLGTFVVNLQGGKYFLKTTITIVFAEQAPFMWMDRRTPIVKDMIITHLRRLSAKKLRKSQVRQLLKKDLRNKLNSLFPNSPGWSDRKPVKKILFQEFYTQ